MVKLLEIVNGTDYLQLPKLEKKQVTILTCPDYYDGPVSGLMLYKHKKYWYQVIREVSDEELEAGTSFYRHYITIELSAQQVKEEEYWEELFRQKVSDNPKYDETGMVVAGIVHPNHLWMEFYEPYNQRSVPDLSNNLVIGWFER